MAPPGRLAPPAGDPDRLRGVDGDARGDLPRAARVLRGTLQKRAQPAGAKVFLPVHLRILLQPLRHGLLPDPHPLPAAAGRLAGVPDRLLRPGGDRQRLHELVRTAAAGGEVGEAGGGEEGEGAGGAGGGARHVAGRGGPAGRGRRAGAERAGTDEQGLMRTSTDELGPRQSVSVWVSPSGPGSSTAARISRARSTSSG